MKIRYIKVTQQYGLQHKAIKSACNKCYKPKAGIHLQTMNHQHGRIRDFLSPFNGVATKYLPNYLNGYWLKQRRYTFKEKLEKLARQTLTVTMCLTFLSNLCQNNLEHSPLRFKCFAIAAWITQKAFKPVFTLAVLQKKEPD